ncbi:MAG TPA: alkaline phosphatase family protein [Acidothermaceae bacterium]|nr:alkaline phosphatase family protein [Acidothermaceae bacterium]
MTLVDPRTVPIPRYGTGSLADLVPSVLSSIGTPSFSNVLSLEPAAAACILLIDGLGAELIRAHSHDAPLLHAALASTAGRDLTSGFPSTTAVSIASIGTGLPPGSHGILGYQVAIPGTSRLMNSLRWDAEVDPLVWQPKPTAFERAVAAGTSVVEVAKREFEGGGLDQAVLRAATFVGSDTFGEIGAGLLAQLKAAVTQRRPCLVYAYVSDLDWTGHGHGVGSLAWRLQLQLVDRLVVQVAQRLPPGAKLYVTADHGMVDIAPEARVDVDAEPWMLDGVRLMGGEPRARYLYVRQGALEDVLAGWTARLGSDAVVCTRDEAIEAGWFGAVSDPYRARIGDVVVAAVADIAVVDSRRHPGEARLIGHHGSLTAAEQLVPLACFAGR